MNNPLEKEVTLITGEKMKAREFLAAYRKLMHLKNNKPHMYEELINSRKRAMQMKVGA